MYVGRPPLSKEEVARRRLELRERKATQPRAKMGRIPKGLWPEVDRIDLARQIGMHPVTVRKILLGIVEASPEAIRDISFILKKEPWRVRRALKTIYEKRKGEF